MSFVWPPPCRDKTGIKATLERLGFKFTTILLFIALLPRAEAANLFLEESAGQSRFPVAAEVTFPKHQYSQKADSLKAVDFKNLHYRLFGNQIRLRSGHVKATVPVPGTDAFNQIELSLKHIWYFDIQNGEPRYALVYLDFFGVDLSTSNYGFLFLFTIANDHPVIVQQFDYDRQAPETAVRFNATGGQLTIKGRARDGSSRCCPENLETDDFHWTGRIFRLRNRTITKLTGAERCCPADM